MIKLLFILFYVLGMGSVTQAEVPVYRYGVLEITGGLKPFITQQMPQVEDFDIILDNVATILQGQGSLEVIDLRLSPDQRRFSGLIALVLDGQRTAQVRISGRIQVMIEIPVLNHAISGENVISAQDITLLKIPSEKAHPTIVMDAAYLIGKSPFMRTLQPHKPISQNDVRAPILVKRGSIAYVTYRSGAMVLTTQAEAKSDGIKGEVIQFIPPNGKRTIQGVVTGLNAAEITPMGQS